MSSRWKTFEPMNVKMGMILWSTASGARKKGVKLEIDINGLTEEDAAEKRRIALAELKEQCV